MTIMMTNNKPKVKIHLNSWVPHLFFADGVTLGLNVYVKQSHMWHSNLLAHELIHCLQIHSLGKFKFYTSYFGHYLKNLFKGNGHAWAYMNIPYEVEAYNGQYDIYGVFSKVDIVSITGEKEL